MALSFVVEETKRIKTIGSDCCDLATRSNMTGLAHSRWQPVLDIGKAMDMLEGEPHQRSQALRC